MRISNRKIGLGLAAATAVLVGTMAIADNAKPQPPAAGGPGAPMMPMMMAGAGGFDFDAADTDHDGKISKDEFDAWRKAQATAADSDGDGKLSVQEIVAIQMKAMEQVATRRAEHMVAALDTDGDGKLSAAELVGLPAGIFDRVDRNHDGSVDEGELQQARAMMMHGMHGGPGKGDDHHGKPFWQNQNGKGDAPQDGAAPDDGQGGN